MPRISALVTTLLLAASIPSRAQLVAKTGVEAVLPNGRQIRPAGSWTTLAPYPFAIALKPDGSQAAIPSIGFPFALNVIDNPADAQPAIRQLPSLKPGRSHDSDPGIEVHDGLVYSPDGQILYVSTGDSGKVALYATSDWHHIAEIPLDGAIDGKNYTDSYAAAILISPDAKTLFVLDQGNWRVAVIDIASQKVVASLPTGAYPMGIALSPDNSRLYLTNTGLFEYQQIPGADQKDELKTGLKFPPFGYPSKEAREGVTIDGKKIPGLGDENSPRGSSLWTYDIHDLTHPAKIAELRLGDRITEARNGDVGGAAPTGVVADDNAVYVSLSHQDAIAKVSPDGKQLLTQTQLSPFSGPQFEDAQHRPLRGVMPSGLVFRNGRLYVAEAGIDAVAVLDTNTMQIVEHIPAGWNPSAVALSPSGDTLYIVNTKGKGAGPNGGSLHPEDAPSYIGELEYGSLSTIQIASLPAPAELTAAVVANNTYGIANQPPLPHLKHAFLIIRENRTFDEILGDLPHVNGDPSLSRWGIDGWAEEHKSRGGAKPASVLDHLKVTPNLHALAHQYAISDNFYVDSDVSADGHRWVLGIDPTPFFQTAWTSGYGGRRKSFTAMPGPGRRALFGGADAPMPEDEPQFGSLWEHIAGSGLGILNYGEGLEVEGNDELAGSQPEGQRLFLDSPVPKPVFESTDRRYPTFNLGIPDQFRFEEFQRDFSRRVALASKDPSKVPGLIVIRLGGDHTADPRPADGYPYRASYVADNDLALGRIVAFLSKTSIWKDSALFVTEDDAQGGIDHVDAHRSILLVASPWVTPDSVSHQHSSMGSITRTINALLGVGSLNLEDALAGDLTGIFTEKPNLQSFTYVPGDTRVFDPAKAKFAKPKTKQEAAELLDMDDAPKIQQQLEKSKSTLKRPSSDKDND
ncbi:bifunctional YncE family protein/alkaline phosphatase family protein [Acidicapsa dinghuensis]|uniref:Bifunctional YncE family protein/alkaline phosphatase family protein n=1 Tax=Acidicapsa dinghuensis TaxID=2218256 RepID=A0ABW1EHR2_9BACT|nr:bifunctional YncE family protein/alkaline phosphatase family protein [Acidicapsa dinghuensis]